MSSSVAVDEAFYERVKREIVGHLPGHYDSRRLLYDVVRKSESVPGSVHVEIGTLCGGGTVFLLQALKDKGTLDSEFVVCVDPFSGFYEKPDPVVSVETVKRNVVHFGFDPERLIFFQTKSQDTETIAALSRRTVNTVFIDGDHRFDGVKADWVNYSPLVVPGGFVVFDDYVGEEDGRPRGAENPLWQSTSWGQVSRFVDISVLPCLDELGFRPAGKCTNGIAFQKMRPQPRSLGGMLRGAMQRLAGRPPQVGKDERSG